MRRLRVIMAFERVGHRLAHGVTGLEATQEAAPVIGYSAAYDPEKSLLLQSDKIRYIRLSGGIS